VVILDPRDDAGWLPGRRSSCCGQFFGGRFEAFFDLSRQARREHFGLGEFAKRVERLPVDIQPIDQRIAMRGALPPCRDFASVGA
jgi:hypothetical protein